MSSEAFKRKAGVSAARKQVTKDELLVLSHLEIFITGIHHSRTDLVSQIWD